MVAAGPEGGDSRRELLAARSAERRDGQRHGEQAD
jgi:hypothetical protein